MTVELNENIQELTDEADRANVIETIFQESALRDAQRRAAPETHPDFDGEHCVDCGENIPQARLKLLKVRCVDCQSVRERYLKMFASPI